MKIIPTEKQKKSRQVKGKNFAKLDPKRPTTSKKVRNIALYTLINTVVGASFYMGVNSIANDIKESESKHKHNAQIRYVQSYADLGITKEPMFVRAEVDKERFKGYMEDLQEGLVEITELTGATNLLESVALTKDSSIYEINTELSDLRSELNEYKQKAGADYLDFIIAMGLGYGLVMYNGMKMDKLNQRKREMKSLNGKVDENPNSNQIYDLFTSLKKPEFGLSEDFDGLIEVLARAKDVRISSVCDDYLENPEAGFRFSELKGILLQKQSEFEMDEMRVQSEKRKELGEKEYI